MEKYGPPRDREKDNRVRGRDRAEFQMPPPDSGWAGRRARRSTQDGHGEHGGSGSGSGSGWDNHRDRSQEDGEIWDRERRSASRDYHHDRQSSRDLDYGSSSSDRGDRGRRSWGGDARSQDPWTTGGNAHARDRAGWTQGHTDEADPWAKTGSASGWANPASSSSAAEGWGVADGWGAPTPSLDAWGVPTQADDGWGGSDSVAGNDGQGSSSGQVPARDGPSPAQINPGEAVDRTAWGRSPTPVRTAGPSGPTSPPRAQMPQRPSISTSPTRGGQREIGDWIIRDCSTSAPTGQVVPKARPLPPKPAPSALWIERSKPAKFSPVSPQSPVAHRSRNDHLRRSQDQASQRRDLLGAVMQYCKRAMAETSLIPESLKETEASSLSVRLVMEKGEILRGLGATELENALAPLVASHINETHAQSSSPVTSSSHIVDSSSSWQWTCRNPVSKFGSTFHLPTAPLPGSRIILICRWEAPSPSLKGQLECYWTPFVVTLNAETGKEGDFLIPPIEQSRRHITEEVSLNITENVAKGENSVAFKRMKCLGGLDGFTFKIEFLTP